MMLEEIGSGLMLHSPVAQPLAPVPRLLSDSGIRMPESSA